MKACLRRLFALVATLTLASGAAHSETGVGPTSLLIGISTPLTGSYGYVGEEMQAGYRAYLDEVNANGGVNGRKIELVVMDDAYQPKRMFENTKNLIERNKVFALIGYYGTATVAASLPYIEKTKVPFLFPSTGGMLLRRPVMANGFSLRASYRDETSNLAKFAIEDLKLSDFGVFHQDDAYGVATKIGVEEALAAHGLRINATAAYLRNSESVEGALAEVLRAKPKAVFLLANSALALEFIKKASAKHYHPVYLAPSPVSTKLFFDESPRDEKIYLSEVVPSPSDTSISLVRDYQTALKKISKNQAALSNSPAGLAAYLNARVLVEVLKATGPDLNREKFLSQLESVRNLDVGGLKISFSPESHSGFEGVYLVQAADGIAKPIKQLH